MEGSVLLAHTDPASGRNQTLASHCENTAAWCAKFCGDIGLENLGRLIGLLHDMGKGSGEFQDYLVSGDASRRGQIPHSYGGARYCCATWGTDGTVKGLTAQLAAVAICAHHAGLPDVTGTDAQDQLLQRAWPKKEVPYEESLNNFLRAVKQEELSGLFEASQREVGRLCGKIRAFCERIPQGSRKKTFYFQLGLVQRYLLSCLTDADRYDTFLFASGQKAEQVPDLPALWEALAKNLKGYLDGLPSSRPIDRTRHEISQECYAFRHHGAGIFRLAVPTGSGKTMASLRYALNCAEENGKARIFYIAPYKSILDQNADDIRRALQPFDEALLLEHHSDVVLEGKNKEEAARYQMLTQRWSAPIILTTAVQFLNSLFDGRLSCVRRMHSLANSVIVLDEFQAFPIRCTSMLNAALDFLAYACDCSVVLCTATQPNAEEMPVPVLPGDPAQMTEPSEEAFAAFRRTRAVDKTGEGPLSSEQLALFALERLSLCDNLLMILNTKAAAKNLFLKLKQSMKSLPPKGRAPVFCLSTSQCPEHRKAIIKEIRRRLLDKTPGKNRMVCVSTQLIEAGVNLSFQCVARSFAGLDSVAQAAGRCNRHGESPRQRDVFLVRCGEENLSRLPDIRKAQEAADHVLLDYRSNSAQFHDDLLSPEAVRRYYHYYFELQKAQLPYPVSEKDNAGLFAPTTLFDLLSVNPLAGKYSAEHGVPLPQHPMHQAFQTAGKIFEAIENSGMDVIVPYGKGKGLIRRLYGQPEMAELPGLLRQAQHYSVHLFEGERIRLSEYGAIDFLKDIGVAVLKKEFYDPELGVKTQPDEMETLII